MEQTKENKVLDIIITLVKAIQKTQESDDEGHKNYLDDGNNRLWNAKYLLGQILRSYRIDPEHYFISVEANALWNKITDGQEKIENYNYTKQVTVHKECTLDLYKGATKMPDKGEKILNPNGSNVEVGKRRSSCFGRD